ncbi:MAG: GNAT family N-acetyltransferase [Gemmataceae bacterium]|nr:GNAT family N-acetyltransferase [Gemmataceae bacterium]MCI0739557.1 GNAT family N-acetyltransferase [Gemmataceae bacterium]
MTSGLTFRLVTDFAELHNLAAAWQALLDASVSAEPMLAPDWLLPWWRIYGGGQLRVGLFYDHGSPIGLAPLYVRRHWYRRLVPFRRLEFLGADVSEDEGVSSEYLNLIAQAGREQQVAAAFVEQALEGGFGRWDEIVLPALAGDGPMPSFLHNAFAETGRLAQVTETTTASWIALPSTWEEYLNLFPKKKRSGIRNALRDFEDWAQGDWKLVEARTPVELTEGKKILHDLHRERWQVEKQAGVFASPRFLAFHDAYMAGALEKGQLQLFWLLVRGEPVAAIYNIIANGKIYFYQSGRRMDVPDKVRLGIVAIAHALKKAIAAGLREADFLGGPAVYKQQLTNASRPIVQLRVVRTKWKERLRRGMERCLGWVKSMRHGRAICCRSRKGSRL